MVVFVNDTFMVGKRKSRKTEDKILQIFYEGCLKAIPPILICWPVNPEVDVGKMATKVEPSCQYSLAFCLP